MKIRAQMNRDPENLVPHSIRPFTKDHQKMLNRKLFTSVVALMVLLQGCSYTRQPGAIEVGSEVGGTGDVGFTHEPLGANKHLLTVTAAPGMMETEGSIAQRIHISANKFAAKTCLSVFEFVHAPNFDQAIAAGFMKRAKTYVFICKG